MTIYTYKIFVALTFVTALAACNKHTPAWNQMDTADGLMNTQPDSALAVLDGIPASGIKGEETSARYALLKSMALDKNYIDTTTFDVLQPAIDYYTTDGTPDEQLRTYYYQGRIYQNQGNDDLAMQSFMRGKEFCKDASDTLTMANLMVAQASIQYSVYKLDDFINNNLEAANLYRAIGRTDYEISCLANALDGGIINKDKSLTDSVMSIAKECVKKNPELESVIVPYNLSYALRFGNKEEIADILNYYESKESIGDIDRLDIAEAYCKIGDAFNAKRVLEAIPPTSKSQSSLKYLAVKPHILELNGDLTGALQAYQDFYTTIDSIHLNIFSHDLLFAESRHEMEKSNLMEIHRKDRIIGGTLCGIFALVLLLSWLYYRGYSLRTKQMLAEKENENLKLERDNLNLIISRLKDERDNLKELQKEQSELSKPIQDVIKVRLDILNGLLASEITGSESHAKPYHKWIDSIRKDKVKFMNSTREAFAVTNPKFIDYLRSHDLTDEEINYLCLYAIGLRGKEVGEYIELKRHYNVSSEIRHKLGIDEHETNLALYIRRLLSEL